MAAASLFHRPPRSEKSFVRGGTDSKQKGHPDQRKITQPNADKVPAAIGERPPTLIRGVGLTGATTQT